MTEIVEGLTSVLLTALAFVRQGHAVFPVNWPVEHKGQLRCSCGSDSRGRPCGNPQNIPMGSSRPTACFPPPPRAVLSNIGGAISCRRPISASEPMRWW